jgi:hypothetical protein
MMTTNRLFILSSFQGGVSQYSSRWRGGIDTSPAITGEV